MLGTGRVGMAMKKIGKWISRVIGLIVILLGILASSAIMYFLIREIRLAVFYPTNLPINAQITNFEDITFISNPKCKGTANLEISTDYPFQLSLSDIPSIAQSYKVGSLTTMVFDIAFNQSEFEISFSGDKSLDNVTGSLGDDFKRLQGTTSSLTIDLSKVETLNMTEALCSPKIHLFNSSSNYYSAWVSSAPGSYSAIRTVQEIPTNSNMTISIVGPITLLDYPSETIEKISITLSTKTEKSKLFVGAEGYSLSNDFPNIIAVHNEKSGKSEISSGNSFSVDNFDIIEVEIVAPVGKVQFGSYPEIILTDPFTSFSDIKLELPASPYRYFSTEFTHVTIKSDLPHGIVTINGTTPELVYRKQKYGISKWQQLPGYVQAGVFGLLLGIISAGWKIVKNYFQKRHTKKITEVDYHPAPGNFVCTLASGISVSGKLSKAPTFFSPYYVIRDAHRKHKNDLTWESEIIEEIYIKAKHIEQYYFKGK